MAEQGLKGKKSGFRKLLRSVRSSAEDMCKLPAFQWLSVVALAVVVTLVTTLSFQTMPTRIQEGQIASRDIKADRNYEVVDEEASKKFRDEAVAAVLPVLDFDPGMKGAVLARVSQAFAAARKVYEKWSELENVKTRGKKSALLPDEAVTQIEEVFADHLGIDAPPERLKSLVNSGLGTMAEAHIQTLVSLAMDIPLITKQEETELSASKGAVMRTIGAAALEGASPAESIIDDLSSLETVSDRRKEMELPTEMASDFSDKQQREAVLEISRLLVKPNLMLNRPETNRRLEEAAASATNVVLKVSAGEMIVREGSRYEPRHIKIITAIAKEKRRGSYYKEFLGTLVLSLLFLIVPCVLLDRYFRRIVVKKNDFVLMSFVGLVMLVIMRISLMLAPGVSEALFFSSDPSALYYMVPIAGGAMLLRMYLGTEIALVFALVISVLAGLFVETDIRFMAFSLITSMTAIMAITNVDRRSQIIKAGIIAGGMGAVTVLGIRLIESVSAAGSFAAWEVLWGCVCACLGGLGAAVFTMIGAPIIESISDYTSDIKLLELANLNHPLLRELIVRAPGTYHHSHVVGLLGEAAAQSIGANALLVRVGAYYHDIGKIKKPVYFIENARAGENRHEKLTPQMSSLIVAAHVKDGQELALNAKIPTCITDMIPQHHGTRRISFFYDKAKLQTDPELMEVDPKQFQYPGPKPQTREAAILMLSDVTEASVRALKEKSPTRIEQTVQKTIHDIFNESQLDECDLTLKDLNSIGKAFVRILLGIYHLRIEYDKEIEHEKALHPERKKDEGTPPRTEERSSDDEPTIKEDQAGAPKVVPRNERQD
jgi:hypothetical protein